MGELIDETRGEIEQAVGKLIGDDELLRECRRDVIKNKIKGAIADVKDAVRMLARLALPTLLATTALSACASTSPKDFHTGDRIINPNRFTVGEHVRILEVGEGDKQFDESQSFKGLICTVGKDGLRNDWSDGYFEGVLERCSNGGKSYRFQYVRVEALEKS